MASSCGPDITEKQYGHGDIVVMKTPYGGMLHTVAPSHIADATSSQAVMKPALSSRIDNWSVIDSCRSCCVFY